MSQSKLADNIREGFLESLRGLGALVVTMNELAAESAEGSMREIFERLGKAGREVYLIRGIGLVNIHVRGEAPGWWNILKTVKVDFENLQELGIKCFFVLLIGRNDRFVADGYIARNFRSAPFVRLPRAEATKYTVNEKQHLDQLRKLASVDRVAKALLSSQGAEVMSGKAKQ